MIFVVTIGSQAIFLVVVGVAWDPLVGVYLLDMLHDTLVFDIVRAAVCDGVSDGWVR